MKNISVLMLFENSIVNGVESLNLIKSCGIEFFFHISPIDVCNADRFSNAWNNGFWRIWERLAISVELSDL